MSFSKRGHLDLCIDVGAVVIALASGAFLRSFCEELGKRLGGSAADWMSRVRVRRKPRDDNKAELTVLLHDSETIVELDVEGMFSDEAKLALIDLDLSAEGIRGHRVKWDAKARQWVVADEVEQQG
jgi:hypothetical protein